MMAVTRADAYPECVLVLAPLGRDGPVLRRLLDANGLTAVPCCDAEDLTGRLGAGAGAVLLTEEALTAPSAETLARALAAQPPWSDLPLLLLAGLSPLEAHS